MTAIVSNKLNKTDNKEKEKKFEKPTKEKCKAQFGEDWN